MDLTTDAAKHVELTTENVKEIVPKMTFDLHKGQSGRIGVIGGSKEYTGAPYFAAFSALKLGADLSHIFCTEAAGIPLKTYSPDLIVHPMLDMDDVADQIRYWLPRLHSVVIGPGLGRNEKILRNVKEIISVIKEQQKPVVIDGDGLFLVTQEPDIIANYKHAILTPNVIEFERLYEAVLKSKANRENRAEEAVLLSRRLGGISIAAKGEIDIITNGEVVAKVYEVGSPRRCGGQGDILAGAIGTFNCWAYMKKSVITIPASILACYAGCVFLKKLNKMTFDELSVEEPGDCGRSMVTGDMMKNIGRSFCMTFK